MKQQNFLIIGAALLIGLAVGFFVTNQINRRELETLRAETVRLRALSAEPNTNAANNSGAANATAFSDLSDEEIRTAIARADAEPDNIDLQAKLGRSIYLVSVETNRLDFLPDITRMLERVRKARPEDFETLMMLGDCQTIEARSRIEKTPTDNPNKRLDINRQLARARDYYEQAARLKPDSVEARTRLGLTYFFESPPQAARAIEEYQKALQIDSQHQPTLQNLAAAQIELKQFDEAQRTIEQISRVNAQNTGLPTLRAKLAESRNSPAAKSN